MGLLHGFQKPLPILIIAVDRLALVAPRRHVIHGVRKFHSNRSCHAARVASDPQDINCQELTPSPGANLATPVRAVFCVASGVFGHPAYADCISPRRGGPYWRVADQEPCWARIRQCTGWTDDWQDAESSLPVGMGGLGGGRFAAGTGCAASCLCRVVPPRGRRASRALLDTVTSGATSISLRMRGTTPPVTVRAHRLLRRDGPVNRVRKCARARGGVRWGSMVNALGFHGRCYRVTGHLRARHVLGKTPFLDEVTRASPRYESTWSFRPDQQKPSNKCFRRNALPNIDLGLFMDGIVGHLDGLFQGLPGTRFSA